MNREVESLPLIDWFQWIVQFTTPSLRCPTRLGWFVYTYLTGALNPVVKGAEWTGTDLNVE